MLSDQQLWVKLKEGNRYAFEMLFHRFYNDLYRYAIKFCNNRHLAEDQIQNLFLKIWLRKECLGEVKGVKTYLWTALRRGLIAALENDNKRQNRIPKEDQEKFSLPAEEIIIKKEQEKLQKAELQIIIKTLTPRQKEILYLRFYEGMSYEEIEVIMSVNYQVARNYVSQSLKSLRNELTSKTSAKDSHEEIYGLK